MDCKDLSQKLRNSILEGYEIKMGGFNFLIGEGGVFDLGNGMVAKGGAAHDPKKEFRIGKELEENGVNVPHFYDLVKPDNLPKSFRNRAKWQTNYVIMEMIDGYPTGILDNFKKGEAKKQYQEQIRMVYLLGLKPDDSSWDRNTIFGKDNKLYLIDFSHWKKSWRRIFSFYR